MRRQGAKAMKSRCGQEQQTVGAEQRRQRPALPQRCRPALALVFDHRVSPPVLRSFSAPSFSLPPRIFARLVRIVLCPEDVSHGVIVVVIVVAPQSILGHGSMVAAR